MAVPGSLATHPSLNVRHGLQARCKQPEGEQMVPASGSLALTDSAALIEAVLSVCRPGSHLRLDEAEPAFPRWAAPLDDARGQPGRG
jgi:hypothetical protein